MYNKAESSETTERISMIFTDLPCYAGFMLEIWKPHWNLFTRLVATRPQIDNL